MSCKVCSGELIELGALGRTRYFKCSGCGLQCSVSGPARKKPKEKK
jgi:hypothetical protein